MGQSWTNRVHRVMLLCAVQLSLYLNCYAGVDQGGKKITLNVVNESCLRVFKQIEKQTKMSFFYSTSDISLPAKVTIKAVEMPLDEVMGLILDGTGLEWIYTDNVITVRKKKEQGGLMGGTGDSSITTIAVSGKVTDANGEAIPGATVLVKRTRDGVTTDADGRFTLANTRKNDHLLISSIGYETREISVNGKSVMVKLNLAVSDLDETVVIAYGTTTNRENTGNVGTVKSEEIQKQPISNPLQALQGRIPGIFITQGTGVPGGNFGVSIRGQNSITNGNDPLYIIDGVPYPSSLLYNLGGSIIGTGSPLNYVNLNNIESISVLKDADATAIHGSRGANGVVLITTKKGKPGSPKVDLNFYTGVGRVTRQLHLLDTRQYLSMRTEAFRNDNTTPDEFNAPDLLVWDTSRYTNWQKMLIGNTARYTDAQLSFSGGNALTQFLIGSGYHKETSVFPGDFTDQKISFNFNVNNSSQNQKFHSTVSATYTVDNNRQPLRSMTDFVTLAPNAPKIYNGDGSLNWENSTWINPFAVLQTKYKNETTNLVGNAQLSYNIAKGLDLKGSFGYTRMEISEIVLQPLTSFSPMENKTSGSSSFVSNATRSWIIEPQASYQQKLFKGNLSILIGFTIQQNNGKGQIINATGFTNDALLENMQAASAITTGSFTNYIYKYNALFSRLNYEWKNKLILNLTGRRDGSSRFGPGRQFSNFGAIGAAWIFSEESSIQKILPLLSFGKVRASYGVTGNDQIGDYRFLDLYNTTSYPFMGTVGLYPSNLFNPELAWEVNKKIEIGLELGFLNNRILFNTSYFRNRSSNQLLNYNLPSLTGFYSIPTNLPALVQNTGLELSTKTTNINANNLKWTSSINLTISQNKLVEFPNFGNSGYDGTYIIGQPITGIKVYNFAQVDPQTGLYQFFDKDGKTTLQPNFQTDRTHFVNTAPQYYGGLQNTIQYKRLQLDFLFQFVKQTKANYLFLTGYPSGILNYNPPTDALNRWQDQNNPAKYQKFTRSFGDGYQTYTYAQASTLAYSDASFIRLKSLSLSYQLPSTLLRRIHIEDVSIYIQGQNLLTFTSYLFDPETGTALPPLKVLTTGIRIRF